MAAVAVGEDHACLNCECPYTQTGLAHLPASSELLEYYRERVETFEGLEEDYLARVEGLQSSAQERHKARWQFLRAEAEVLDLQAALSDAKIALFDERERVVQLCAENDALKIQEMEDRQRIQQLLALTQPATEEITLFKDRIPRQLIQPSRRLIEGSPDASAIFSDPSREKAHAHAQMSMSMVSNGSSPPVLRTVFMPNKNVEALSFEIESIRLQAQEQKRLWKEKEEVLLEDRRVKEAEIRQMRERHDAQVADLEAKIVDLERDVTATTKDYLLIRHHAGKQVHEAQKALSQTQKQYQEIFERFQELHAKAEADVQDAAQAVQDRDKCIVQAHVNQAERAEQEVYSLKTQLATENVVNTRKVSELQDLLMQTKARNKEMATKMQQAINGLNLDMLALKRQVRAVIPALHQLLRSKSNTVGGVGAVSSQPGPQEIRNFRSEAAKRNKSVASRRSGDLGGGGGGGAGRGNVIRTPMHEVEDEPVMPATEILKELKNILNSLDKFQLDSEKVTHTWGRSSAVVETRG